MGPVPRVDRCRRGRVLPDLHGGRDRHPTVSAAHRLPRRAHPALARLLVDAVRVPGRPHEPVSRPQLRAAIAALTVFSFLLAWNQYLWPLLVTNDDSHRTVQIGLKALSGASIARLNLVSAGAVIASLPIFVLLLLFQRHLVRGLTSGAVKG